MEFEDHYQEEFPETPPVEPQRPKTPEPAYNTVYIQQPKKKSGWRIFWRILFVLSVMVNIFLFLGILGLGAVMTTTQGAFRTDSVFTEHVIRRGDHRNKIVVIRIEGIINREASEEFRKQIKAAAKDRNVKALIIRTITPGGSVSASDEIHHEISKFRKETNKPVVAFMQSVAASGGYYTSVACDRIVSEPTVITGSIGVIATNLVLKGLLEDKLGVQPYVFKSGQKKDWPSMFTETTDEQRQYIMERLINPAYERFVDLVDQGRDMLDHDQVLALADGSIFTATQAHDENLVDRIGYIDEAIDSTEFLANIQNAHVVEYTRRFTLSSILSSESNSILKIDKNTLHEMAVPELMYIWDARW